MRVYQNYSSHYESIDSYSAISNEVQTQFCTCTEGGDSCRHSTIQDSNYQHEADIRRVCVKRIIIIIKQYFTNHYVEYSKKRQSRLLFSRGTGMYTLR